MNTERPENDDAAREPETTGSEETTAREASARETSGEKASDGKAAAAEAAAGESAADAVAAAGTKAGKAAVPEEADAVEQAGAPDPTEAEAPDHAASAACAPAEAATSDAVAADAGGPQEPGRPESGGEPLPAPPSGSAAPSPADTAPDTDVDADTDADADADADEHVVAREPGGADEGSRGSRRRSPALIASVAAAVLLVGGGAAYLTSGALSGSGDGAAAGAPSGEGTPAALALDDYSTGAGAGAGTASAAPEGGVHGIAPGEPNPYGVTYRAEGTLPAGPRSAPVYWARGEVTKDQVAGLAKALGVEGTPVADGEAWKVGAGNDGAGPVLRVNRQAPGLWTFTRYAPGTDDCTGGTAKCTKGPGATPGDPVSEAVAKKAAAPVLKAVGQDDAKIDASQIMGAQRVVNADPVIGGLPSYGWTTGVRVNAQGEVVGGNGQLEAPVKGATYPLVSAREALEALNSAPGTGHRMGIGGCASPVPLKDRLESPCGTPTASGQGQTAVVEDAALGLAPHTSGGRQVLVPSWLFEVKAEGTADAYTVTQPAVEPAFLTSSMTPEPAPTPSGAAKQRDVRVSGYAAEGDELTVSFTGGVCADYRATAVESGDEVKVTVTETPWPKKVCIMIAKEFHRSVQLDEPLGGRKVVGSDGRGIALEKPGARLPQTR